MMMLHQRLGGQRISLCGVEGFRYEKPDFEASFSGNKNASRFMGSRSKSTGWQHYSGSCVSFRREGYFPMSTSHSFLEPPNPSPL
jgi:hypothetical protein